MFRVYKLNRERMAETCLGFAFIIVGSRWLFKVNKFNDFDGPLGEDAYEVHEYGWDLIQVSDGGSLYFDDADWSVLENEASDGVYDLADIFDSIEKALAFVRQYRQNLRN